MSDCPHPTKGRYATAKAGRRALRGIRHPHGLLGVYRCGNHWHLGHPDVLITKRRKAGR